jgi:membrane protease YdiL (CAAX protease family)
MHIFAQQNTPAGLATLFFLAFAACLVAWAAIIERIAAGKPILPYQPRRRVPWRFMDLLAIFGFFLAASVLVYSTALPTSPTKIPGLDENAAIGKTSVDHPIVQLLAAGNWTAIALCVLSGVVLAPIIEELFFRVLLQGWLETVDGTMRRRVRVLRDIMPRAAMPICVSSLIFAAQHFRREAPQKDVNYLTLVFLCYIIVTLLSLAFAVLWTRWRTGARAVDLGWVPTKLVADIRLGLTTFLAVAAPIYAIQVFLPLLLPKQFAPDPVPLFFFAVALGFLYNRTHRVAPSIVLHMALNATSLAMFFLWGPG